MIRADRAVSASTLVWMLGVTQVVGYGSLYYSFAILSESIAETYDWPVSWVFGAFSFALLIGGFVAPLAGRWMDAHGAPRMMALGSIGAALSLVGIAVAPDPTTFTIALVALECVSTFVLYDAAFTALVQLRREDARLRITHLTLIAGFASTIFWPLTTWLHGFLDWRTVMLVFAAINAFVCAPLHWALAIAGKNAAHSDSRTAVAAPGSTFDPGPPLPPELARRVFGLVTIGFALSGFLLSALLAQMVPALTALGLGTTALIVSTLFGPAQVLVRFVNMVFGVRRHPLFVTLFGMSMLPLAVLILAMSAPMAAGAAVFAVLLGFGSGLKSIVQGTLPLALFGSASYGTRLGRMALVRQFLAAAAPFTFAWHLEAQGPTAALVTLALVGVLGVAAFAEIARIRRAVARLPTDIAESKA